MKRSDYALSAMQCALLGAGVGTFSQAARVNYEKSREAWQSRIDAAYRAASKKISQGQADPKTVAEYVRLKKKVSPAMRRLF